MEMDDEVKNLKGTSYDFGARMYDPRVGRWLSRDAHSDRKPDLSPYQAFKNNPLVYIDPDGNDEWQVVKVVDQNGNQLARIAWKTSSTALMSGSYSTMHGMFGEEYHQSFGYDFKHVYTIRVNSDYEVIETTSQVMLMEYNGAKDMRQDCATCLPSITGYPVEEGEIYDYEFEQPGGLYITGSDGEGTKYYSKNASDFGNIDLLLGLAGAINTKLSPTKEAFNEYMTGQAVDALVKTLFSENGILHEGYVDFDDVGKKLIQQAKDENANITVIQPYKRGDVLTYQWWPITKQESQTYPNGTFNEAGDTLTLPTITE